MALRTLSGSDRDQLQTPRDLTPPSRRVTARYIDPLEVIWIACASDLGWSVQRSAEVFASWDGAGRLTLGRDGDLDGDGVINADDSDIDGDGIINIDDSDIDGDGIVNSEDEDLDGDGINDTEDTNFPINTFLANYTSIGPSDTNGIINMEDLFFILDNWLQPWPSPGLE